MFKPRGNDGKGNVQKRSWFLDRRKNEELDGEIMNAFEYIGLTLIAFGLGVLILLGTVYIISRFIE